MNIIHDDWGEEGGVWEMPARQGWTKRVQDRHVSFFYEDGWREKPDAVWVETMPYRVGTMWQEGQHLPVNPPSRLRCVARYDIPTGTDLDQGIESFKKPCLILEQRQGRCEQGTNGAERWDYVEAWPIGKIYDDYCELPCQDNERLRVVERSDRPCLIIERRQL